MVGADEPGGALTRLAIDSERWAEQVPPVPDGYRVTVAFSSEDLAVEHAEAIELLGYQVVGAHDGSRGDRSPREGLRAADFLVSDRLAESHPAWWHALAGLASQVYVLHLGPVRRLLGEVLTVHGVTSRASSGPGTA